MSLLFANWTLVLLILGALQIADIASTIRALNNGATEANPIIAFFMETLGDTGWIVAKLTIAALAAFLFFNSGVIWPVWLMCLVYAYVVRRNLRLAT